MYECTGPRLIFKPERGIVGKEMGGERGRKGEEQSAKRERRQQREREILV